MATPIAHSLIGATLGLIQFLPRYQARRELPAIFWKIRHPLLLCILLANAPDLDYLYGIFVRNLNQYHQTVTHTLLWNIILAAILIIYARRLHLRAWQTWLIPTLLASHLLLDWLTVDLAPPVGMMLAWPVADHYFHSAWLLFPAPAKADWQALWSTHNLQVAAIEAGMLLPFPVLVLWLKSIRPACWFR